MIASNDNGKFENLSEDELKFLAMYRSFPPEKKRAMHELLFRWRNNLDPLEGAEASAWLERRALELKYQMSSKVGGAS